jgi:hypothetical protein
MSTAPGLQVGRVSGDTDTGGLSEITGQCLSEGLAVSSAKQRYGPELDQHLRRHVKPTNPWWRVDGGIDLRLDRGLPSHSLGMFRVRHHAAAVHRSKKIPLRTFYDTFTTAIHFRSVT